MRKETRPRSKSYSLPALKEIPVPTVADQVFHALQQRVLTLELPPGIKISEAEVARQMGVSRQPVREAFKRLAQIGFLVIRPQSSTMVTLISENAVLQARFIRTALEVKTCRTVCEVVTKEGLDHLHGLIDAQKRAIEDQNKDQFHALDDAFHEEICIQAGTGYVWDLINDSKAHMDRIRMLSLDSLSRNIAYDEHVALLGAISARDADTAEKIITAHLSRILILIANLKSQNHGWFAENLD